MGFGPGVAGGGDHGKSYLDVRQAFEDLGIDEAAARRLGVRLYKVAMPFPLEPEGARRFAQGLDTHRPSSRRSAR